MKKMNLVTVIVGLIIGFTLTLIEVNVANACAKEEEMAQAENAREPASKKNKAHKKGAKKGKKKKQHRT